MVRSLPEGISPALIAQARDNPSGQSAWQYPAVLEVVATLAERGYALLGGDVLHAAEDAPLDYFRDELYCGNWYRNRQPEESWADYVAGCAAVAQRYIEAYVRRNGDAYWFVPVFADEHGFARLRRPGT
jgi:hypothetical protein